MPGGKLRHLISLAAALLLAAVMAGPAASASPPRSGATIAGTVAVGRPETRRSRERLRARHERAAPLRAHAAVIVRDERSGAVVLRATVITNTTFVLVLAPGVYRVAARIGPPLVNPSPRSCGAAHVVRAQGSRRVFVAFACTLG